MPDSRRMRQQPGEAADDCEGGFCPPQLIEFTQSARRHRVGKARALRVLADPVAIVPVVTPEGRAMRMFLGDDDTGRALEVGVLDTAHGGLIVVHVMDLRLKYRGPYQTGKEEQ